MRPADQPGEPSIMSNFEWTMLVLVLGYLFAVMLITYIATHISKGD